MNYRWNCKKRYWFRLILTKNWCQFKGTIPLDMICTPKPEQNLNADGKCTVTLLYIPEISIIVALWYFCINSDLYSRRYSLDVDIPHGYWIKWFLIYVGLRTSCSQFGAFERCKQMLVAVKSLQTKDHFSTVHNPKWETI